MFCRRVCQRLGPVAQRFFTPTCTKAPVRHMAFGVPGGSTNMTYFVLCGGGLTAAVVYAYKTVIGDSERYEDRLANMGSTTKVEASAESAIAAPESAPVEEPEVPVEVVTESVAASSEPVADITSEVIVESVTLEDVDVVSEVIATEDEVEPPAEEEAPSVVAEAVSTPVEATEETPAEETTAEAPASAEALPDLLTAVKILAGSTVEIAAASVGESSLVRAVRHIEDDGKGLDSVLEVLQSENLEETKDLMAKEPSHETVVLTKEEELSAVEVVSCDEAAVPEGNVSAEESAEASSPATEKEEEVPSEETTTSGPTEEENAGGIHDDDQNPDPEENITPEEASPEEDQNPDPEENITPEEASPEEDTSEEANISAEAPVDKELPGAETFVEDAAEVEAPEEETVTASEEEGTSQPPQADTESDMEVLSVAEPQSNQSLAQAMMPTDDQPSEILEDTGDKMNESKEAAAPVETQSPDGAVVMMNQS
ncbi:fibrous sheath CABYR-binding protein isoform X2 [Syngnathus scovelli]|uniref:fibrous sheath CABYR-binding protein isoform X2 n=1 Tax=Syngnathus scovelli TaxID=161590 RepID=UPI002110DC52|nr:fibrous sheath CABYR-binding protein isoform X2 [Syngnathus scovelli]